jgi:hypothetical protein
MREWLFILGGIGFVVALLILLRHRVKRVRLYGELAEKRTPVVQEHAPTIQTPADVNQLAAEFRQALLVRVENFFDPPSLARIRGDIQANATRVERSFVPLHKQGGTVSYEKIHYHAPACLGVYHSETVRQWLSRVVNEDIKPTADHDQSSCSLLYYQQPGDHINWHFDHNFYKGRHFTVLLSVVNQSQSGGLSSSKLMHRSRDGQDVAVDTSENVLVVFEGAKVLHKVTPIGAGESRAVLSMTFCTNPSIGWFKELCRRVKDTAFFGIRTLWD